MTTFVVAAPLQIRPVEVKILSAAIT